MKRILFAAIAVAAASAAMAFSPAHAVAAKPAPSPSATASAAPLPTASPEPPNIAIPRLIDKLKANPNDREALSQITNYYLQVNRPDLAAQHHRRFQKC